jgi:hypothetical protein
MNLTFEVAKCTETKEKKFVWKLVVNTPVQVFGLTKIIKRTYYIGGMPSAVEIGTKFTEDFDKFEVQEFEFMHPETGEMMKLKWLMTKPR